MNNTIYTTKLEKENLPNAFDIEVESPSNIALVKYWGKKPIQIPTNPSLSFTLSESQTKTQVLFKKVKEGTADFVVFFEGEANQSFRPKITKFLNAIAEYCPWLQQYSLEIHTQNTFPHSSGIASSASGMSALAKAFVGFEASVSGGEVNIEKVSFLARIGSGSACRSVYPGLVSWGKHDGLKGSSDLFATPLKQEIHPVFNDFCDSILLVHEGQKTVSSTVGHGLMDNHPYAEARFESANENLSKLLAILSSGDLEAFGKLVEHEALALHAMMMTSDPAFILMQPQTVAVLNRIWEVREQQKLSVYFTLDAGANVHILYPKHAQEAVRRFIEEELLQYTQNGQVIHDYVAKS